MTNKPNKLDGWEYVVFVLAIVALALLVYLFPEL